MSDASAVFVPPGSRARGFAEAICWLWRLGRVSGDPAPGAVGFGWLEDAPELDRRTRRGEIAGAVVFAPRPGPEVGRVPGRERKAGIADFGPGGRVTGQFTVLHGGTACARSSIGVHATRDGSWLVAGIDPDAAWGTLDGFWLYPALLDFLAETLAEPPLLLPPIGWFRYDDVPGNAYQQLAGRDHSDRYWRRRLRRLRETFSGAGAIANLAITPKGLVDGAPAFVDRIWPEAMEEIARGIEEQVFEPVTHGYCHVEPEALARGEAEPREFRTMDEPSAAARLDEALEWLTETIGSTPASFVAPTWSYGDGLMAALAERGIRAWLPARPGPLLEGRFARESLVSTLNGLYRLDYQPLGVLARAGYPPTLVIHGGLFDSRMKSLSVRRDPGALARLAWRRDMFRVPWAEGVRWIGAGEMLDRLAAHDRASVEGGQAKLPDGAEGVLWEPAGPRTVGRR